MRLLFAYNMANDGWNNVKGLRRLGVDAHLLLERPCHVTRCPQWEEAEVDENRVGSPDDPDWTVLNEHWNLPDYVHVYGLWRSHLFGRPIPFSRSMKRLYQKVMNVRRLGDYDLIVGLPPFALEAPSYQKRYGRKYIIYECGWIRYLHDPYYESKSGICETARIGYRNAAKIIVTNVDTFDIFLKNGYPEQQLFYSPFAVDMELYAPKSPSVGFGDRHPIFFSPSRQDWPEKGNQYLIQAFAEYLKHQPKALLILTDWGQPPGILDDADYLTRSKQLVAELGIERSVWWIPLVSKHRMIELYNAADIIFDQYIFGALGTTTPEALSCGRPIVAHVRGDLWRRWHDSPPPVADATDAAMILQRMRQLEDVGKRKELGELGRRWIKENCELSFVARKQLEICKETL